MKPNEQQAPERIWANLFNGKWYPEEDRLLKNAEAEVEYVRADIARATQPAAAPSDSEDQSCPFCNERGFDLIGLKSHLQNGDCETFENLERLRRL